MTHAETRRSATSYQQPLRLWPGVAIVAVQWVLWSAVPRLYASDLAVMLGVLGGVVGGLAIIVWWGFFSRAPRSERLGAPLLMVLAVAVTSPFLDPSIGTAGMGMMFFFYVTPVVSLAFVAWALASQRLAAGARRVALVATILVACGTWTLLRSNGMTGDARLDFAWRWTETAEEQLLSLEGDEPLAPVLQTAPAVREPESVTVDTEREAVEPAPAVVPAEDSLAEVVHELPSAPPVATESHHPVVEAHAEWPGFRGPGRDSTIHGVRIETDWSQSPPVELWRRPIGPAVSSFAVAGDLLYTQEQRGDDEIVAAYDLTTGEPVWRHHDAARFWDSHAGAGPRGTPTLSGGRVYTLGATGIVNALDASTGAVIWSRDAAADTEVTIPGWGLASSPLVVEGLVIVATAGELAAYDTATGTPRWFGPDGGDGYSSPQLVTLDGVAQVLLLSATGAISVAPGDGAVLWQHEWPVDARIVQPALTEDGDLLLPADGMLGTRRIAVTHGPDGWTTEERWTSNRLKPFYNDFVVHDGHAFGFDGSILACIDLETGKRAWKGGRYGHGQLVLLADQDVLLVVSEEGELALVGAVIDGFTELARFPAIDGKTWNHPVLVGDRLLVRNSEEMVAFRLPLAE